MGARIGGGRRSKFAESTSTLAIATVLMASTAHAADLTISNAVTTPVNTSTANNGPGNITIQSGGSVAVTGPVAVTIDSSNTVSNAGTVSNAQETGAVGIRGLLTGGNLNSSITNTGTISIPGPASTSTAFNSNTFNAGIRIDGPGTFTGTILNDVGGTIGVGGNASYGIQVGGALVGNVVNNATINAGGTNSFGIMTTGPVTGSIVSTGTITAGSLGGTGIYVGGPMSGSIAIGGPVSGTATGGTITVGTGPTTDGSGNPVYQIPGQAAVWIASNVTNGMTITGNGFTKAQENPIVNGVTTTNTNISTAGESTISSIAGGPALLIAPGGPGGFQNIDVGQIVNQGNILASSSLPRNTNSKSVNPYTNPFGIVTTSIGTTYVNVPGIASTGVDVEGAVNNGTTYTTFVSGGFYNTGGNVDVTATNATATGFLLTNHGGMSVINNTGDILVNSVDTTFDPTKTSAGDLGGNAYGVLVGPTGRLDQFINSGHLTVTAQGTGYSAYGVIDQSGTLSLFNNSGDIEPSINPYNTTGTIVAVDLSHNTTGVNFTDTGVIRGPVFLGSGTNTVSYSGGTQIGNLSFTGGTNTLGISNTSFTGNITLGGGASNVSITNGSVVNGGVVSTGTANLNVLSQSQLTIPDTSLVKVTNATLDSTSKVNFSLNGTGGATGIIQASGNVDISPGASLAPIFTGIIQSPQTVDLVSSSVLNLHGASVASFFPTATSYMNAYTIQLDPNNANNIQITARRRTAAEMGLATNMSAAYEGSIGALTLDQPVAAAISAQNTKADFVSAFRQLMPDTSDAIRQTALSAQNMALGAVRRRLAGIPNSTNTEDGDLASFWLQGLGTIANASNNGPDDTQPGYSYWGLGVALGADWPVAAHTKLGANLTETFTSVNLGVTPNSFLLVYASQLNAYARQDIGRFYIQGIGGAGLNNYDQKRLITIGSLRRTATGKSSGYQAGGNVEAGVRLEGGDIQITPYVRAGYLKLHQDSYSEKNGGIGVDLTEGDKNTSSLRATGGLNLERDFAAGYDSFIETDLRGSYTHDFKNDPLTFTSQFTTGGSPFTTISLPHGPNIYSFGFGIGHKDSFSSVTLDYDAEITGHFVGHVASVTMRFRM